MQYKIYEGVFDAFEKKIKRIINKCTKYGNPFVYEVLGEQFETIKEKNDFGEQFERTYKFVLVNVEGTAKIDNWEFIATLEHTSSGGNIIKNVWNDVSVPDRFKTSEPVCEHCNGKRMRRLLYIVRNTKTNEFKQIGSTCVKSYTRGLSAEQIACYLDGMTEFEEYNGFVPSNGKAYYRVEEVLTIAANVVDTIGYFNTSNDKLSTKDIAEKTLSGFKESHAVREVNSRLCKAGLRFEFTRETLFGKSDKVNDIINYYVNLDDNSNFVHNIQVIIKEGWVSPDSLGFICYMPEGYRKHMEAEDKRKAYLEKKKTERESEISAYYGDTGKRYKNVSLRNVTLLTCFETVYGVSRLYKIILESGHVLTWITSTRLEDDELKSNYITFTVKEHREYKEQLQTSVTRCKFC